MSIEAHLFVFYIVHTDIKAAWHCLLGDRSRQALARLRHQIAFYEDDFPHSQFLYHLISLRALFALCSASGWATQYIVGSECATYWMAASFAGLKRVRCAALSMDWVSSANFYVGSWIVLGCVQPGSICMRWGKCIVGKGIRDHELLMHMTRTRRLTSLCDGKWIKFVCLGCVKWWILFKIPLIFKSNLLLQISHL